MRNWIPRKPAFSVTGGENLAKNQSGRVPLIIHTTNKACGNKASEASLNRCRKNDENSASSSGLNSWQSLEVGTILAADPDIKSKRDLLQYKSQSIGALLLVFNTPLHKTSQYE
jgi:hypothetical protein